ncbi:Uncharacterised protein [uncultured archaeon]|nr:Uncharacterised protein [uncultured archaeon]
MHKQVSEGHSEKHAQSNSGWFKKTPLLAAALALSLATGVSVHQKKVERQRHENRIHSQAKLDHVYELSKELRSQISYERGRTDLETVQNAMEAFKRLKLKYEKNPGKDAAKVLIDGSGNCVSFSRILLIMLKEKGIDSKILSVFSEEDGSATMHSAVAAFIDARAELKYDGSRFVIVDPTREMIGSKYRNVRLLEPEQEYANYLVDLGASSTDTAKTISVLEDALSFDPDNILVLKNLGIEYTKRGNYGDYETAKTYFKRALRLDKTTGSRSAYITALIGQKTFDTAEMNRKHKEIDRQIELLDEQIEKEKSRSRR